MKKGTKKKNIFVFASMPRSGSTFMYHELPKHPQLFAPRIAIDGAINKETGFFSVNFSRGEDWFLELFQDMSKDQLGVDVSAVYISDLDSAQRIKNFNNDIKVIMCLRDPVDCVLSSYANFSFWNAQLPDFEEFLSQGIPLRLGMGKVDVAQAWLGLPTTVTAYMDTFKSNLLVYSFSLFQRDPLKVLKAIEQFVGLPAYFSEATFENVKINSSEAGRSRVLSALINCRPLVWGFKMFLPYRWQAQIHLQLLKWCGRKESSPEFSSDLAHRELASVALREQRRFVEDLFKRSEMIRGDKTPFLLSD